MPAVELRLFAAAREAAGRSADDFEMPPTSTIAALLAEAEGRYGAEFAAVLGAVERLVRGQQRHQRQDGLAGPLGGPQRVGDEPAAGLETMLQEGDEVAVLPPVSGGA